MRSRYDGVISIASMAAVGIVFGFLGGVVAGTQAVAFPIASIAVLLIGTAFVLSHTAPPLRIITSLGQTKIMKGFR